MTRSARCRGVVHRRSRVPLARSRSMVTLVTRNMTAMGRIAIMETARESKSTSPRGESR